MRESDYQKLKQQFLEMYGYVCACCGEFNPKFLTLDHIKNDGADERAFIVWDGPPQFKKPMPRMSYRPTMHFLRDAVLKYQPEKYQILCFNCNCARAHNDGVCPHKRELKGEKTTRIWRLVQREVANLEED